MEIKIIEILDKEEKKAISKEVLNDLPEWFGLSESTQNILVIHRINHLWLLT